MYEVMTLVILNELFFIIIVELQLCFLTIVNFFVDVCNGPVITRLSQITFRI